jgi:hypothetical protein
MFCPIDPESLALGVVGHFGQSPASLGFQTKLCRVIGHWPSSR